MWESKTYEVCQQFRKQLGIDDDVRFIVTRDGDLHFNKGTICQLERIARFGYTSSTSTAGKKRFAQ